MTSQERLIAECRAESVLDHNFPLGMLHSVRAGLG